MNARHGRVLAELADAGMVMVRGLSQAMERTDDPATRIQIGLAYHRCSRAVRQTIALEVRLSQEPREPRPATASSRPAPAAQPAAPRPQVERADWNEYERPEADEADEALDALDVLLDADEVDPDAVCEAVEASITRIRRDLTANPVLVKAGVLEAPPAPNTRRTSLMMGASPSFPTPWERGTARRAAGEERGVERASLIRRSP